MWQYYGEFVSMQSLNVHYKIGGTNQHLQSPQQCQRKHKQSTDWLARTEKNCIVIVNNLLLVLY